LRHGDLGVPALRLGQVHRAVGRRLEVAVQAAAEVVDIRVRGVRAVGRDARVALGAQEGRGRRGERLAAIEAARAGARGDLVVAVVDDVGVERRRGQQARLRGDEGLVVRGRRLARLGVNRVPRVPLVVAVRDGVAGRGDALVDVEDAAGRRVDVHVRV